MPTLCKNCGVISRESRYRLILPLREIDKKKITASNGIKSVPSCRQPADIWDRLFAF